MTHGRAEHAFEQSTHGYGEPKCAGQQQNITSCCRSHGAYALGHFFAYVCCCALRCPILVSRGAHSATSRSSVILPSSTGWSSTSGLEPEARWHCVGWGRGYISSGATLSALAFERGRFPVEFRLWALVLEPCAVVVGCKRGCLHRPLARSRRSAPLIAAHGHCSCGALGCA